VFNVGANTLVAVLNTIGVLKINQKLDQHKIQAEELWTLENHKNTKIFKNKVLRIYFIVMFVLQLQLNALK
jgi:hypothetical protein